MTPEERLAPLLAAVPDARLSVSYGDVCVDVEPADWLAALTAARDGVGCTYFDWLSAVDELDAFSVVASVADIGEPGAAFFLLLRTRVPAEPGDTAALPSATGIFRGAAWHERETAEMFGLDFPGHPGLTPLLLPDGFEGHPLRKSFVLAARVAKPWPGAKEPGESDDAPATGRRRTVAPGLPDPSWGPRPPQALDLPPADAPDPSDG